MMQLEIVVLHLKRFIAKNLGAVKEISSQQSQISNIKVNRLTISYFRLRL